MILTEFPQGQNCRRFFKKHKFDKYVQLFDIFRRFLSCLHVVGLLDVLMVSNSAELRSFLLTKSILAPESTTNSLSSGSFVDAAGSTHSPTGKWNVALSFSLSLCLFLARFQALLRAHRCCRSVSSWDQGLR